MKNKVTVISVVMLLLCIMCTGCDKKETEEIRSEKEIEVTDTWFTYEESATVFTVDEEGMLYVVKNEDFTEEGWRHQIVVYDLNGNCIEKELFYQGSGTIQDMVWAEGELYYVVSSWAKERQCTDLLFYRYNPEKETHDYVAAIEDCMSLEQLTAVGNNLFFIIKEEERENVSYELHESTPFFSYQGEVVYQLSLKNGKMSEVEISFPMNIAAGANNTLLVNAYDEERGYCFFEVNPDSGEKTFVNTTFLGSFAPFTLCNGSSEIAFFSGENSGFLGYMNIKGDGSYSQVEGGIGVGYRMYSRGGLLYYSDYNQERIVRVKLSEFLKNNEPIRYLIADGMGEKPYGCGYNMQQTKLDTNNFAMKILAQDTDYDLCLLSSSQDISDNLRTNGAFYPLNEVEGVQEYLDACFPALKEAATTENGDIWMLPVTMDVTAIMYQKDTCKEKDFAIQDMDYLTFMEETFQRNVLREDKLYVDNFYLQDTFFIQYLHQEEDVDTELFRQSMELFYQHREEEIFYNYNEVNRIRGGEKFSYLYFMEWFSKEWKFYGEVVGDDSNIGVAALPPLPGHEGEGTAATCMFLAVNPQSSQLEETLSYITALCEYLMTQRNSLVLKDAATYDDTPFYRDLLTVYENAEIMFQIDYDLYWSDFTAYMDGEVTKEEMIAEVQRKLDTYRGE